LVSAEIIVYNREFNTRPDAERITAQLGSLAKDTLANLQDLQDILTVYRQADNSSGRTESPVEPSRAQDVRHTLLKHTNAFQRVAQFVEGREDWTKLSPKAPLPPSRSPDILGSSKNNLQPGEPSSSNITISTPPSPYQPTVEDFEGSSDEEVEPNVQEYHYVPPEENKPQVQDSEPLSRVETRTPPQVIIRTATDPSLVESPRKPLEAQSSPLSYSSSAYGQSPESSRPKEQVSRKSSGQHQSPELPRLMTKVVRPQQTAEEVQDEIKRLQDELEFLRVSRSAVQEGEVKRRKSRRRHQHSVDLRNENDYPHEELPARRKRSSTTTLDRPQSYIDESSSDNRRESRRSPRDSAVDEPLRRTLSGKTRLSPGHSPRHPRSPRNPYSATEPQLDKYGRADPLDYGAGYAADTYGNDPRTSLPTLVESSARSGATRARRNTTTNRAHRLSQHMDVPVDFRDYFSQGAGGAQDFELFGPPSAGPRPRGDSRTHSTSPANLVSPSPRNQNVDDTHDDLATVRKLPVTLEELFYGTTKRVKIKRQRYHTQFGRFSEEEKILDVPIYKGLKPGSKVKFQSEGDETLLGSAKELHFILMEVRDSTFLSIHLQSNTSIGEPSNLHEKELRPPHVP
jgi:hypothetical protein